MNGALAEIDQATDELGLAGHGLKPGFVEPARHPDDALYFSIYEHLVRQGIALFLISGPPTPDPAFSDLGQLAQLAWAFLQLRIVCYHGYHPKNQQLLSVAFRYNSVLVMPDMYQYLPGSEVFLQAANGFMADQLLFGSSYPFRQSIDDFVGLGFKASVLDKLLYDNAAQLFGLPD